MDEKNAAVLIDEIHQLTQQFRLEIPGKRRVWPESIKSRVLKLRELGLRNKQICRQSGLPYDTLLKWLHKEGRLRKQLKTNLNQEGRFMPLRICDDRSTATVTVAVSPGLAIPPHSTDATVTVSLPGGIRVEGVTAEFLRSWLGRGELG